MVRQLDDLVVTMPERNTLPRIASVWIAAGFLFAGAGCATARPSASPQPHNPAIGVTTPDSLAALAGVRLRAGDTIAAIAAYRLAVATDPTHLSAGVLITLLYDAGRTAEALELGERYRRNGPRNPRALFRYGWALGFLWERARADSVFRELIALDNGGIYEAWGNGELAHLARAHGDLDGAVGFMELARRARPEDVISRVGVATMLLDAGRPKEALSILEVEVAADSLARGYGALPALLLLASARLQAGDTPGAHAAIERLRPRISTLSPVRQLQFYNTAGEHTTALSLARRTPHIPLYGSPDPGDHLLAGLRGTPEFEALLARSRAHVNARRLSMGLPARN